MSKRPILLHVPFMQLNCRRVRKLAMKVAYACDPVCRYCRKPLKPATCTADHVHPLSLGGSHDPSNLILSCRPCNMMKAGSTLAEWRQHLLSMVSAVDSFVAEGKGVTA